MDRTPREDEKVLADSGPNEGFLTPAEPAGSDDTPAKSTGRVGSIRTGSSKKSVGKKVETTTYTPFLPTDLIGGAVPYIPGTEEEAVWNAASQACGTERVHVVYSIDENRCWYLATPSANLSSHPDSWCPLAAALPGNSEFWDKETVYLYEQEGSAAALRWDPETGRMQVFSGASRTILPRIQSLDANFVTVHAETAKPCLWTSRFLNQEKLSRWAIKALFLTGFGVLLGGLAFASMFQLLIMQQSPDLQVVANQTREATNQLLVEASSMRSETHKHLYRIQDLLVRLGEVGGTLVRYEVDKKKNVTEWEALVPQVVGATSLSQFSAEVVGREEDGRLRIKGKR